MFYVTREKILSLHILKGIQENILGYVLQTAIEDTTQLNARITKP